MRDGERRYSLPKLPQVDLHFRRLHVKFVVQHELYRLDAGADLPLDLEYWRTGALGFGFSGEARRTKG